MDSNMIVELLQIVIPEMVSSNSLDPEELCSKAIEGLLNHHQTENLNDERRSEAIDKFDSLSLVSYIKEKICESYPYNHDSLQLRSSTSQQYPLTDDPMAVNTSNEDALDMIPSDILYSVLGNRENVNIIQYVCKDLVSELNDQIHDIASATAEDSNSRLLSFHIQKELNELCFEEAKDRQTRKRAKKSGNESTKKSALYQSIFDMNFDELPDYEPLDITLNILTEDPCNMIGLRKILNMDAGDLHEHPQWFDLLKLLRQGCIKAQSAETIITLSLIYLKFISFFEGLSQGVDVCIEYLECLTLSWGGGSRCVSGDDIKSATFYHPSYIISLLLPDSDKVEYFVEVLSHELYQVLFHTLIKAIQSINIRDLSYVHRQRIDHLLVCVFTLLTHGYIQCPSVVSEDQIKAGSSQEIKLSVLDILIYIDAGICDTIEMICKHSIGLVILHHGMSTEFLPSLYRLISDSTRRLKVVLKTYKALDYELSKAVAEEEFKERKAKFDMLETRLGWTVKRNLSYLRLFVHLTDNYVSDPRLILTQMKRISPQNSASNVSKSTISRNNESPVAAASNSPSNISIEALTTSEGRKIELEFISETNKLFSGLKPSNISISELYNRYSLEVVDTNDTNDSLRDVLSNSSNSGDISDWITFLEAVTSFITSDIMSIMSIITVDDSVAISWLTSLSSVLGILLQSSYDYNLHSPSRRQLNYQHKSLESLADIDSYLILFQYCANEIIRAYNSINEAVQASKDHIDAQSNLRIKSVLDNLLVVLLENLHVSMERYGSNKIDGNDTIIPLSLCRVLMDVTIILSNHDKIDVFLEESENDEDMDVMQSTDNPMEMADMSQFHEVKAPKGDSSNPVDYLYGYNADEFNINETIGRLLQLTWRSWRCVLSTQSSHIYQSISSNDIAMDSRDTKDNLAMYLTVILSISLQLFRRVYEQFMRICESKPAIDLFIGHIRFDEPALESISYTKKVAIQALSFVIESLSHIRHLFDKNDSAISNMKAGIGQLRSESNENEIFIEFLLDALSRIIETFLMNINSALLQTYPTFPPIGQSYDTHDTTLCGEDDRMRLVSSDTHKLLSFQIDHLLPIMVDAISGAISFLSLSIPHEEISQSITEALSSQDSITSLWHINDTKSNMEYSLISQVLDTIEKHPFAAELMQNEWDDAEVVTEHRLAGDTPAVTILKAFADVLNLFDIAGIDYSIKDQDIFKKILKMYCPQSR